MKTDALILPDLASKINTAHRLATEAMQAGLAHALEAGKLLVQAKTQVPFGTWTAWLAEHFDGSDRTARLYMQIARRWPEIQAKRQRDAILSLREAITLIEAPKPDEPEIEQQTLLQLVESVVDEAVSTRDYFSVSKALSIHSQVLDLMITSLSNGNWSKEFEQCVEQFQKLGIVFNEGLSADPSREKFEEILRKLMQVDEKHHLLMFVFARYGRQRGYHKKLREIDPDLYRAMYRNSA